MMNLFFTTSVWIDLKDQAVKGCVKMREFFSSHPLSSYDYGPLEEVSFVIVSIYDNEADNIRRCAEVTKGSSFKDFLTGEKKRLVTVGVCVPPSELEGVDAAEFVSVFAAHIPRSLEEASKYFPKKFEFEKFLSDIRAGIKELVAKKLEQ